ncbi:DinB family protein [Thiomonas delicata]|jgi:uncharacterized damage-inducible protein DinB|uniref:DinB family protein n=2 Tax=Thiomonas TaxID=32012 RepID=A0A238D2I9_THIDL|nr:DinB family protein [Thiomonas delicata]SBP87452.1 DinB family protein [Thiomonas delicata]
MSPTTLRSLFGYKSWANQELFSALAGLPAEHAEHLHTCIRTLNHIYVVDRIFKAHLSAEPRPFDATNTKSTPTLAQLWSDVAATDAWYEQYAASLSATNLAEVIDFEFTDGDSGRMSREEILLHVIAHGGYHRGNVGQVLKSISLPPPRDLYTKFLHQSEPARREAPTRRSPLSSHVKPHE